jgi:hypothetical protein
MTEPRDIDIDEQEQPRTVEMPRPRAVGSPLATGIGSRPAILAARPEPRLEPRQELRQDQTPGPGPAGPRLERPGLENRPGPESRLERGLEDRSEPQPEPAARSFASHKAAADDPAPDQPSSLQRAVNGVRAAWPFVQKILPLLDGQVITAVTNLLTPHHPPAAQVNLTPLENSLTDLRTRHGELSEQLTVQNTSLKRVEDRLEMVREATDRNTLEQQELLTDLKSVGRKVNVIAVLALLLLAGSIAVNVLLFLHIRRVLP